MFLLTDVFQTIRRVPGLLLIGSFFLFVSLLVVGIEQKMAGMIGAPWSSMDLPLKSPNKHWNQEAFEHIEPSTRDQEKETGRNGPESISTDDAWASHEETEPLALVSFWRASLYEKTQLGTGAGDRCGTTENFEFLELKLEAATGPVLSAIRGTRLQNALCSALVHSLWIPKTSGSPGDGQS